jgi:hypothetical protein
MTTFPHVPEWIKIDPTEHAKTMDLRYIDCEVEETKHFVDAQVDYRYPNEH